MANALKSNLNAARPTPGEGGAPTGVDEYAAWFNQTFTFAKAIVKIDERGRKYLDLDYRG
jgi:hypothetical protein